MLVINVTIYIFPVFREVNEDNMVFRSVSLNSTDDISKQVNIKLIIYTIFFYIYMKIDHRIKDPCI